MALRIGNVMARAAAGTPAPREPPARLRSKAQSAGMSVGSSIGSQHLLDATARAPRRLRASGCTGAACRALHGVVPVAGFEIAQPAQCVSDRMHVAAQQRAARPGHPAQLGQRLLQDCSRWPTTRPQMVRFCPRTGHRQRRQTALGPGRCPRRAATSASSVPAHHLRSAATDPRRSRVSAPRRSARSTYPPSAASQHRAQLWPCSVCRQQAEHGARSSACITGLWACAG